MDPANLRSPRIWPWPVTGGLLGVLIASLAPPGIWICLVGGVLLSVATDNNPTRPAFWSDFPWRRGSNVNLKYWETVLCLSGAALVAAPLIVMLVRSLISR